MIPRLLQHYDWDWNVYGCLITMVAAGGVLFAIVYCLGDGFSSESLGELGYAVVGLGVAYAAWCFYRKFMD